MSSQEPDLLLEGRTRTRRRAKARRWLMSAGSGWPDMTGGLFVPKPTREVAYHHPYSI
jgi:hypothetical protein